MDPLLYLLVGAGVVFATKIPLGLAQVRAAGGYNNSNPREQQQALDGWGKRALGAHLNTIEAYPFFAAGVLAAVVAEAEGLVQEAA